MFERSHFHQTLTALHLTDPGDEFAKLRRAHEEPGRHYHNCRHIGDCLSKLNEFRHLAERPDELALAIWFHDAVYDSTAKDNEERSADWAEAFLQSNEARAELIERITSLILATKSHEADTHDAQMMIDIDLSILGSEPHKFDAYDEAIRREYVWVPEADYRRGRAVVLRNFLDRKWIYHSLPIREQFEERARQNLRRKLQQLG